MFERILKFLFGNSEAKPEKKPASEKKPIVINVLAPEFYNDCHIKGSINVPFNQLEHYAKSLEKNQEIIAYCANYQCPASKQATKLLGQMGFDYVYAYEGGICEWFQRKLPTEGPCSMDYLKIPILKSKESDLNVKVITAEDLFKRLYS